MIKLIWVAAILTAQGPMMGEVPESTTFKDRVECQAFGEKMTPRLQDYVRGLAKADWHDDVQVAFRCEANGQPV